GNARDDVAFSLIKEIADVHFADVGKHIHPHVAHDFHPYVHKDHRRYVSKDIGDKYRQNDDAAHKEQRAKIAKSLYSAKHVVIKEVGKVLLGKAEIRDTLVRGNFLRRFLLEYDIEERHEQYDIHQPENNGNKR